MSLASQYGANTLNTTLAVEKALAELEPALKSQGITVYPALHRPANFIERALGNLEHSLRDRGHPDFGRAVSVSARCARGAHRLYGHPFVAAGRDRGARSHGLHLEHHDARRICGGAWGCWSTMPSSASKISCAVCAKTDRLAEPKPAVGRAARCVARSARSGHLCDRRGRRGVPAGIVHLERPGPLRRTLGIGVHFCRAGVAAGRAHLHPRAVRAVAAAA